MLLVAVVGLIAGGQRLFQRRAGFRERAKLFAKHEATEWAWRKSFLDRDQKQPGPPTEGEGRSSYPIGYPDEIRVGSVYYTRLRLKYERAARFPWLAVPRDPPEPK
jgi:hypothetical protein